MALTATIKEALRQKPLVKTSMDRDSRGDVCKQRIQRRVPLKINGGRRLVTK